MRKIYNYLILILLTFVLTLTYCRGIPFETEPGSVGEKYNSVRLRVKVITKTRKEKTKILLGFNRKGDRLIFLGPLNQVLFEILIEGNHAKVIVPKKKKYWTGEFRDFISRLWGLDFSYNEIRALLLERRVSAKKMRKNGLKMQIFDSEKKKYPVLIKLSGKNIKFEFKVYEIKERKGSIVFNKDLKGYSKVSLDLLIIKNR